MAKTLAGAAGVAASLTPADVNYFVIASAANTAGRTSEDGTLRTIYDDITVANLTVTASANSLTTASTVITIRKNGADTGLTITIPPGTTGEFTDSSNTVSFTSGDTISGSIAVDAGGAGTVTYRGAMVSIGKTTGALALLGCSGSVTYTVATAAWYGSFSGSVQTSSITENTVQTTARGDGILDKLQVNIQTNTRVTDTTIRVRINNANGNGVVTVPAGTTGWFIDTSNSDTVADGDVFGQAIIGGGTGTTDLQIRGILVDYTASGSELKTPFLMGSNLSTAASSTSASNTTTALGEMAFVGGTATRFTLPYDAVLSDLHIYVSVNPSTTDRTLSLNVEGTPTTLALTIPASSGAGFFSDLVNTFSVENGEDISVQLTGSASGTLRTRFIAMWQTVTDPVPPVGNDGLQQIRSRLNLGLGMGLTRFA